MMKFKDIGLSKEVLLSLDEMGFTEASPIQEEAIPYILRSKKDLIALAQTGTGKTAAFSLPIIEKMKKNGELEAVILCPTRELCLQTSENLKKFVSHSRSIKIAAVYGGERIDRQISAVRKGANLVVGTPGRVRDLIRRKVLNLSTITWVVLDEADEMLDMGFKDDLDAILSEMPETRQTLLFSATMSKSVRSIASRYMHDIQEISIGEKNVGADNVSHEYYLIDHRDRFEALKRILDNNPDIYGIVFCRTKNETQSTAEELKRFGYAAEALHGDISQEMRSKTMDRFRKKQIKILVATDVAARGVDVKELSHVINYNLPDQDEAYTHRSGRTGRAQKSGISISIVSPREKRRIGYLENSIGKDFEVKKVPSKTDVIKRQVEVLLNNIRNTDDSELKNNEFYQSAFKDMSDVLKEDLIKHILTEKLNCLIELDEKDRDLNCSAREKKSYLKKGDQANLKLNLGHKDRFDPKALFHLINSSRELKGASIGRIDVRSQFTLFSVEKDRAEMVIKNLNKREHKGKNIRCSKDNGSVHSGFSRKKRSFKGRRKKH
ncbi:DEAD/DEAH box helicase [Candidatus Falkowbacteria bacterium]|nr:DEAD/DEAH box helicase [Candidatus Falkowbacteria bacterium]